MAKKTHKRINGLYSQHACGEGERQDLSCCATHWKHVTCKKCLIKKKGK